MKRYVLIGIDVLCIRCLERKAKYIVLNFPLCKECAEASDV